MITKTKKRSYSKRRVSRDARSKQAFFMLRKDDMKVMSTNAALFIALLADIERRANNGPKKLTKEICWVYCTIPYVAKELGIPRRAQDRSVSELEKKRFLKKTLRGNPPKRFFFVDWEKIEDAIQETYGDRYNDEEEFFDDDEQSCQPIPNCAKRTN